MVLYIGWLKSGFGLNMPCIFGTGIQFGHNVHHQAVFAVVAGNFTIRNREFFLIIH
jgi:hypothetical protein